MMRATGGSSGTPRELSVDSHHFQAGRPGVAAPFRDDGAGVVSDVTRPGLADEEGPILLHHYSGAAGRADDHVVLLPDVAAAKQRALR